MKFHLALGRCLSFWQRRGYSRTQLAHEVGCSVGSISHWANDRRPIEHHFACSLVRIFAATLTGPKEKVALTELVAAYEEKFPSRPINEIYDLLDKLLDNPKSDEVEPNHPPAMNLVSQSNRVSNQMIESSVAAAQRRGQAFSLGVLSVLLLTIFHNQISTGAVSIWQRVWVNDQFAPAPLAFWCLMIYFTLFYFLGLEGQGAKNRAKWVSQGTWRDQYISTVNNVLKMVDKWVLSERRAKKLPLNSFRRNWSIELYEKALLFAILYPILAVMVQWTLTGAQQTFGQFVVWPEELDLWRRLLIFSTFVASVPIAFLARSQAKKRWRILLSIFAIIVNFVGYIACWVFYSGVTVGPGAVNMAAVAFICGIGLRAFDNVAVPIASASIAGSLLGFAFLPILTVAEFLNGKPGIGYTDIDVRLTHALINHSLNLILFFCLLKFLSKFINSKSIEAKTHLGVAIYAFVSVGTAVLMFVATTQGFWTEYYLFLGLIPLMNGVFDFLSIGLTRYTLRLGTQHFGFRTLMFCIVDLILAFFLFAALIASALIIMQILNVASGGAVLPPKGGVAGCEVDNIFNSIANFGASSPSQISGNAVCNDPFFDQILNKPAELAWLIFIFASTLIPTFLHIVFAFFALGPALLSDGAKAKIAYWSENAADDLFLRGAAALSFALWLTVVTVVTALVVERLIWFLTAPNGLFAVLIQILGSVWF